MAPVIDAIRGWAGGGGAAAPTWAGGPCTGRLGPCLPDSVAVDWAFGGGEFFAGTVERFLAWAAGTYVNVKAVGDGRVYARRSVPNRNRRVSPVSVLAALMFRGVVTEEHLWGPVLPSWYVERYWHRPYGTVPRESVRALARYVTKIPEQLRDLLDVLKVPEWETVKAIAGGT